MNLLSVFSTGALVVNAIRSLSFGASGGVVLGDFSFAGFEVPEYITIGGHQAMTVHKLPGGERVVDLLGPDERDLDWSGAIIDGDPAARARQLDQMRADGNELALTWGPFFYTVVIKSFEAETHYSLVKYRISCLVLYNDATAPKIVDPSLTDSVAGDLMAAVNTATTAIAPVLSYAQTAVAALGPLIPGSQSLALASAAIGVAQGAMVSAQSTAAAAFGVGAGTGAGVSDGPSLLSTVSASGTMAQLSQAGAYLGRTVRNVAA